MMFKKSTLLLALLLMMVFLGQFMVFATVAGDFQNPPANIRARPLWFWNGNVDQTYIETELTQAQNSGYSGVAILPATGYGNYSYLSEGFFSQYGIAVNKARQLGLKLCLYDEFDYPSGSIGGGVNGYNGQFNAKYPNDTAKRLEKTEETFNNRSAGNYTKTVPNDGAFMGATAMNNSTKAITVLSTGAGDRCDKNGTTITITGVPALPGNQTIFLFMCVKDYSDTVVDYLEPDAVQKFITEVHQKYYDHFSADFGPVIDSTFYDEPRMWGTDCNNQSNTMACKMWTPKYNEKFQAKYGSSPVQYYPALWYDIGTNTAAARNLLFGFRAELFAQGYFKTINDWCGAHGSIKFTGHIEGEECVNPTGGCGDLIKVFKYQEIPGVDEVYDYYRSDGTYGRTSCSFKVVSSSAFNYDKPLVMTETNGASGNGDPGNLNHSVYRLYKEAFDQLAKGINYFVPHAILTNLSQTWYYPDLSYKNVGPPNYATELPSYNTFIGRCQTLLQGGRHLADIGVLYPIATLHSGFRFDSGYESFEFAGSEPVPEADYLNLGELLSLKVRRDYTFLHPEVINEKCAVQGNMLHLNNTNNYEDYKVMIVPGSKTISADALLKIKNFYDNGGKVIFTKCLPTKSAEISRDTDVSNAITAILGSYKYGPLYSASSSFPTADINCMYEPSKAGDDNTNTRWNSKGGDGTGSWLQIDFGQAKTFNNVDLKEFDSRITGYNIQYYNGSSWQNCYTGTTIGEGGVQPPFSAVTASKVRLYVTACTTNNVSIREFQVFNGTTNLSFPVDSVNKHLCNSNGNGGKAYFIPNANESILRDTLDDALANYDVEIPVLSITGGNLSYIHKIKNGMDEYYFANSGDNSVDTYVEIRGRITPQLWNPHTGVISNPEYSYINNAGQDITRVRLILAPVKSVFVCNSNEPVTGNLALGKAISASTIWQLGPGYEADKANDGNDQSRWNAGDLSGGNQWLEINFGTATAFNKTIIKEAFDRISSYNIQYWDGSTWINCVTGTTIGASKTDQLVPVTASKIRLYINSLNVSNSSASIYEFEVYNDQTATPTATPTPVVTPQPVVVDQDDSGASFTMYHDIYSNVQRYQIFTPSTANLPRVDVYTYKYGSPAAALTLQIVSLDGSDNPTGAALYSIDIPASSVPTSLSAVSIYPNLTTLTPGANYAILWKAPGCPDLNNDYGFGYTDTNPYPNGYEKYTANGGSTWNPESSRDLKFTTYKLSGPTPTPTPLLTDDFSGDLSKWVNTANASISGGQLTVTNNEIMRSASGGTNWINYTFEVDAKITSASAGMVFRSVDDNNFYMWQLNTANGGKLRPHKKVGGSWTVIKEVSTGTVANVMYHVKIEVSGSTIKTYLDGNLVDTTTDTAFSSGKVGFREHSTESAVFDNVVVKGL